MAMTTRDAQLEDLLRSLFPLPGELHRFLHRHEDGRDILESIPGPSAPINEFAHLAVVALGARGMLDEPFFAALVQARRRRAADIVPVASLWIKDFAPPPPPRQIERSLDVETPGGLLVPPAPQKIDGDSRAALEARWGGIARARTPTVPVFLADGRDGLLSDARWRARKGSGGIDLIAVVYDPDGVPMGSPDGTVIGTCWRTDPKVWRFSAMKAPTAEGHTGGNSPGEAEARKELLDAVAKHAPRIREILVWDVLFTAPGLSLVVRQVAELPREGEDSVNVLDIYRRRVVSVAHGFFEDGGIVRVELGEPIAPEGCYNPHYGPIPRGRHGGG